VRRRSIILTAAAICLVGLGVAFVAYRGTYANWPWQGPPVRLHSCGRIYENSVRTTNRARQLSDNGLREIFRAPPVVGRQVFVTNSDGTQDSKRAARCATGIFVRTGEDSYESYALLGGP
jgi:uncharacterized protein YcfJ